MYWILAIILVLFFGPTVWAAHDPGELESESKSWLWAQLEKACTFVGGIIKTIVQTAVDGIRDFFTVIEKAIWTLWTSLKTFLTYFWENLQRLFYIAYNTFSDAWTWIKSEASIAYDFLATSFRNYWKAFCDTVAGSWESFKDFVYWCGDTLFDWFWGFVDWAISIPYNIFLWMLDQLPKFVLPRGFDDGFRLFREYGGLLDKAFPAHELFALLVVYFSFLVIFSIVRWILSLKKLF